MRKMQDKWQKTGGIIRERENTVFTETGFIETIYYRDSDIHSLILRVVYKP